MKTGKHSVVIGNVPTSSNIGEGSVVIGATDSHGNTFITTPMAVGYGAKAGHGSIAIGAFAGSGLPDLSFPPELQSEMESLVNVAVRQSNQQLISAIEKLTAELRQPMPKKSAVLTSWEAVKAIATVDGAYNMLAKASTALLAYISQNGV
jgi:hypothetical protein